MTGVGDGVELFGRRDAVQAVGDLMADGGRMVAIGDPGAGKSSLLRMAAAVGRRGGRRILSVTPTQFEQGLPFAGLAELISQCPDLGRTLPSPQRRALAVALHQDEPGRHEIDALAVSLAIQGILTTLCEAEPVALLIDDLQWLDRSSGGSLGFALRRTAVAPARLSVLVASRPDPEAGTDLIASLPEPRHEFVLRPLDDWAVGQLLRRRLGPRWTAPMSAGVARASGGNPFLALEIARAMQRSAGHVLDSGAPLPSSLAGLLHDRIAQLPDDVREVLLLAAAPGRVTVAQLQRIVEPARLRIALEAAADADVARVDAESTVAFTHPLLTSALYDGAAPGARRRAHRALAQAVDDPVERARHRAKTITVPDAETASELDRAAEISLVRGARQAAGELLEAAALATPIEANSAVAFGRWLRAVDAYLAGGDAVAAQAALDKGAPLGGDPQRRAQVLMRRAELIDYRPGRLPLLEQALHTAPAGSEIHAEVVQTLGEYHRMTGDGRRALQLTNLAIIEAAAIKRADLEFAALYTRISIERHWGVGDPGQSFRDLDLLVERSAVTVPAAEWAWAHSFYAAWNDQNAEPIVREGIRRTIEDGLYGHLSSLYISLVIVLIRASRIGAAKDALDEADRLGAWAHHALQQDMARVLVREYTGDLDEARAIARDAISKSRAGGLSYWVGGFLAQLGFIEASAGNPQAALEPLRELAGIFAATEMVDLEQLLWAVDYADAALQVGAHDEVEAAVAVLRRQAAAGRPEAAPAADRCDALLAAARGDLEAALGELRRVVDRPDTECPFEAARSRLALGQVYRRAGYKATATRTLTAAADAFAELGIPRWAQRARDEAGRVGLHPSTTTLTAAEQRVAELVGSGRSNQETAAELFMSVKTVEANLTRIYRKLGVRSRTELANHMNKNQRGGRPDRGSDDDRSHHGQAR